MHEQSLITALLHKINMIAHHENVNTVSKIHFKIGACAQISVSGFQKYFDEIRKGTVAEHAEVIITQDDDVYAPNATDITLISVNLPEDG